MCYQEVFILVASFCDLCLQLTFPVRVFAKMGIKLMFATNACGSLNPSYNVGDLMIMRDHINLPGLTGLSPLVGLNDERFEAIVNV